MFAQDLSRNPELCDNTSYCNWCTNNPINLKQKWYRETHTAGHFFPIWPICKVLYCLSR